MFERFTERARNAVVFAQDEARSLGHNYIGTEHLLLGLLREEEGLASRALESLGVTLVDVRTDVARIIGEGGEPQPGQIPFTPRGKKVLELSLREAKALGHNYIGTEHILLGIVRENKGVAARILLDLGADADKVRDEVIRALSEPGRPRHATEAPPQGFDPQTPPLAPEVAAEIEKVRDAKEEALERGDLERATELRTSEHRLTEAAARLIRVWNEKRDLT